MRGQLQPVIPYEVKFICLSEFIFTRSLETEAHEVLCELFHQSCLFQDLALFPPLELDTCFPCSVCFPF